MSEIQSNPAPAPAPGADGKLPVDFNWLNECTDDDNDALKTILNLYFTRTPPLIEQLAQAIAVSKPDDMRRLAHACVGSSGTCGMTKLTPLFKALEQKGTAGSIDGAAETLAEIRREFTAAHECVDAHFKNLSD